MSFNVQDRNVQTGILSKNLGAHGAYFWTDVCPKIGDYVKVELVLTSEPDEKSGFEEFGTVLRVDEVSEEKYGVAVQFDAVPDLKEYSL